MRIIVHKIFKLYGLSMLRYKVEFGGGRYYPNFPYALQEFYIMYPNCKNCNELSVDILFETAVCKLDDCRKSYFDKKRWVMKIIIYKHNKHQIFYFNSCHGKYVCNNYDFIKILDPKIIGAKCYNCKFREVDYLFEICICTNSEFLGWD